MNLSYIQEGQEWPGAQELCYMGREMEEMLLPLPLPQPYMHSGGTCQEDRPDTREKQIGNTYEAHRV